MKPGNLCQNCRFFVDALTERSFNGSVLSKTRRRSRSRSLWQPVRIQAGSGVSGEEGHPDKPSVHICTRLFVNAEAVSHSAFRERRTSSSIEQKKRPEAQESVCVRLYCLHLSAFSQARDGAPRRSSSSLLIHGGDLRVIRISPPDLRHPAPRLRPPLSLPHSRRL